MKQVEPKQTLSITIPISLYQKLQQEVGKGKISQFIKETVEEKLTEQEDKLTQEYRECYANPRMIKEAKHNGREIKDAHPALVVSNNRQNNASPLIVIIPITSLKASDKVFSFQLLITLEKKSVILVDQIRTIDRDKFKDKITEIDNALMEEIVEKYERYLRCQVVIKKGNEETPVPFIQILDALTGSGKTVILAKVIGEISKLSQENPIIL
ncbi:8456_t:CDS:2 [Funneliformis geosporum]|nr:8456_t:CDS:2 [Funneliformis geosporum]